ncbi:hypothetical protein H072_10995 [Dactylellina haptotyla CBS 200.50]|uniref:WSC domain-containing protein n=1 Tax=Dactylellina haptotyla (strain CBS 200.50) TaxID=1284197 RepID=S7ZXV4_DACHA|nr:hypothetical protein H072_10995 [Dactylellina haptotyla CBS 200.50]
MQFNYALLPLFLAGIAPSVIASPFYIIPRQNNSTDVPTVPAVLNSEILATMTGPSCPPSTIITASRTCIETALPTPMMCVGGGMLRLPYGCSCVGGPPVTATVIPYCSYDCNNRPPYTAYTLTDSSCAAPTKTAD